jgi:Outer membrane protein beta-barrel domain
MNQNINKEFEDKSWDAMRALLDREMPEDGLLIPPSSAAPIVSDDRRKQRWFLPFFMLSTCTVIGFSWYYLTSPMSPIIETKVSTDRNIVENGRSTEGVGVEKTSSFITENKVSTDINAVKNAQNTEGVTVEKTPSSIIEIKVSKGINTVKNAQNTERVTAEKTPSLTAENKVSKGIITGEKAQNTEGEDINKIVNSETQKSTSSETKVSQITDNQIIKSDISQVDKNETVLEKAEKVEKQVRQTSNLPYAFLPLAKAYVFEIRDTNFNINVLQPLLKITTPTKSLPIAWGITSGAHTEGVKKLNGFQAGLFLNKKMGQKWAIQTGLNYRRNTVQGDNMTYVELNSSSINTTITPTTTPVVTTKTTTTPTATTTTTTTITPTATTITTTTITPTGATTTTTETIPASTFNLAQGKEIKLKNLNYLELPVTVHYRFSRKFLAFTGVKVAYLMSNSVTTGDNSKLYVLDIALRDQANKVSANTYVQGNTAQSLGLNRWDGAIIGGISYNILPKMTVGVRYDFGLKNILNQQNWKAYNRYLGLNLSYNFR